MPTYYSRSTTARLHTTNLADIMAPNPVPEIIASRQKYLEKGEGEIARSIGAGSWRELAVACDSGSNVQFLGENANMPFIMVEAGLNLQKLPENDAEHSPNFHNHAISGHAKSDSMPLQSSPLSVASRSEEGVEIPLETSASAKDRGSHENSIGGSTISSDDLPLLRQWQNRRQEHIAKDPSESSALFTVSSSNNAPLFGGNQTRGASHVIDSVEPSTTQGICLSVTLSKNTFLEYSSLKTDHKFMDVKIDVYFNGNLCSSAYCARRLLHADQKTMLQCFSGSRIRQIWEKPWILRGPVDTTLTTPEKSKKDNALDNFCGAMRWASIGAAIHREAEKNGRYEDGELGILGDYLISLSALPMPKVVERLEKAEGLDFGVTDVVVTAGVGGKDAGGTPCLSTPDALRIMKWRQYQRIVTATPAIPKLLSTPNGTPKQSKPKTSEDQRLIQGNAFDLGLRQSGRAVTRRSSTFGTPETTLSDTIKLSRSNRRGSNVTGSQQFEAKLPGKYTHKSPISPTGIVSGAETTPPSFGPTRSVPKNIPQKRYRGSEPEPEIDSTQKKGRMGYVIVVDDKLTEEEEFRAIISKTEKGKVPQTYATRSVLSELPKTLKDTKEHFPFAEGITKTRSGDVLDAQQAITTSLATRSKSEIPVIRPKENPGKITRLKYRRTAGDLSPSLLTTNLAYSSSSIPLQGSPLREFTIPSAALTSTTPYSRSASILSTDLTTLPSASPPPPNATSSEKTGSTDMIMKESDATKQAPGSVTTDMDRACTALTPQSASSTRRSSGGRLRYKIEAKEWKMPELSENSVISYGEGVRQIRRERPGWFEEHSVLCGFRFLIGA